MLATPFSPIRYPGSSTTAFQMIPATMPNSTANPAIVRRRRHRAGSRETGRSSRPSLDWEEWLSPDASGAESDTSVMLTAVSGNTRRAQQGLEIGHQGLGRGDAKLVL